jgi:hypothetical protein
MAPPACSEARSWTWVVLWSLSIFATIPLARTAERFVRDHLGQAAFGWFVIGVIVAAAALTGIAVVRGARARSVRGSLLWLSGIAIAFVASTLSLWSNPEEAMHLVQYGMLAPLLHRALAHRLADSSIYLVGTLLGALVGCLDEAIQWITPQRYFGLRDVGINVYASALVQLAIARGIAPAGIAPGVSPSGLRALARAAVLLWALLLIFSLNTPARVDAYSAALPGLAFLADNPSAMMEYGHRYQEPAIGVFRSRLSPGELRAVDEERGRGVGETVAGWGGSYAEFLARFPSQRDAFAHEFRVHLFRRDANVGSYLESAGDVSRLGHALTVVREDLILRRYFPQAFAACRCPLAPELQRRLESEVPAAAPYESPVSDDLVTQLVEWQLLLVFAVGFVALFAVDRRLGRVSRAGRRRRWHRPAAFPSARVPRLR